MIDVLRDLHQGLARQLDEGRKDRDRLWQSYWEGRRMVTVPENRADDVSITGNTFTNTGGRLFPSFPNLAPKNADMTDVPITAFPFRWENVIRDCIARLKSARAKESTNRNLSTLLAVVVKVQKDLETLVGEEIHAESNADS